MKTLIVYASSHGTTEKAALRIGNLLLGETTVVDAIRSAPPDPMEYDNVIIGGSIHIGSIQRSIRRYATDYLPLLLEKRVGLFVCCMREGDLAEQQFEQAFPKLLREHAVVHGFFGGELLFGKMNFVERGIARLVSGSTNDLSQLDDSAIRQFAGKFNVEQLSNEFDLLKM